MPLKPFCVMKQGRIQWSSWSQRIVTVDTETGVVWVSKKNREDMPSYHKLLCLAVQPWGVYKQKYIDEEVYTKEAMLTVRLKCCELPASHHEKYAVQQTLLEGENTSFGTASPVISSLNPSKTSANAAVTPSPDTITQDTVDCVLRFNSVESLMDFATTMHQVLLQRGEQEAAAHLVSASNRAVACIAQLAVRGLSGGTFTDLM